MYARKALAKLRREVVRNWVLAAFLLFVLMLLTLVSKRSKGTGEGGYSSHVHIFYEVHYRNKIYDGYYSGWNLSETPVETHIASNYYPSLGLYSSRSEQIVNLHMSQINDIGVGVVVVTWWMDAQHEPPDFDLILRCAHRNGLKMALHIKIPADAKVGEIMSALENFFLSYKTHPALYRMFRKNKLLPLVYVYDPYLIEWEKWRQYLTDSGVTSIRQSILDAVYVGLIVEEYNQVNLKMSGFDGFYTHFAINHFTFGSTWSAWPHINDFARKHDLIFIPTVAPGYADSAAKTEGNAMEKDRKQGIYYNNAWTRAIISRSEYVSINSFNNWEDGTQIEAAKQQASVSKYQDYSPRKGDFYMRMTKAAINDFAERLALRKTSL